MTETGQPTPQDDAESWLRAFSLVCVTAHKKGWGRDRLVGEFARYAPGNSLGTADEPTLLQFAEAIS